MNINKRKSMHGFAPYLHLVYFALVYAIISFFCILSLQADPTSTQIFASGLVACLIATILLVAIWSVFGPGTYLKRLAISHCIGGIVGLGLLLGILSLFAIYDNSRGELGVPLLIAVVSIPPLSMAAQLPFWCFRFFSGWQFVLDGDAPGQAFTIRDIFTATFAFAISFSAPQFAIQLSNVGQIAADIGTSQPAAVQTDGSNSLNESDIFVEKQSTQREIEQEMVRVVMFSYLVSAAYALFMSVLCLPIFLFMFRLFSVELGCLSSGLYAVGLCLIPFIFIWGLSGAGNFFPAFGYFLVTSLLICGAISIPLAMSRSKGFELTSPRIYAKRSAGPKGPTVPVEIVETIKEHSNKHALDSEIESIDDSKNDGDSELE